MPPVVARVEGCEVAHVRCTCDPAEVTRTIFYTATTLDGYLADDHDSLDWLFVQEHDAEGPLGYTQFIGDVGALAMGATTYRWLLDHLEKSGEQWSYAMPCWVFTHQDLPMIGDGITTTQQPVGQVHQQMVAAAAGKNVWIVGGGDLACQFAEHGLLDELALSIAPVTLGSGRPLFPRPFDLRLLEHDRNGAFLCARYEVVGPR
jgi:dihydrofolate reductase